MKTDCAMAISLHMILRFAPQVVRIFKLSRSFIQGSRRFVSEIVGRNVIYTTIIILFDCETCKIGKNSFFEGMVSLPN